MPKSATPDRDFLESIAEKVSAGLDLGDSVFTFEELAELQELASQLNKAVCIGCGKLDDIGDYDAFAMAQHIAVCENHPLHIVAKVSTMAIEMITTDCKSFDDIYDMVKDPPNFPSYKAVYLRTKAIREIIEKRTEQFDAFIAANPPPEKKEEE